ncbi:MAG: hypothetical protein L0Y78_08155 [candidate division NC10 bacterium]|nr:hypothetical protein [candidate division NC10 bacterium]
MSFRGMVFGIVVSLVCSACVSAMPAVSGRVGELHGRIVGIEREKGLIAVATEPDTEAQWLSLVPSTSVRGPDISTVDALRAGQRVYVRYHHEPGSDRPEVLSITVVKYALNPKGTGPGSVKLPGF